MQPFLRRLSPLRISTPRPEAFTWRYIPQRYIPANGCWSRFARTFVGLYGLQKLELTATHPESELQKIEPDQS